MRNLHREAMSVSEPSAPVSFSITQSSQIMTQELLSDSVSSVDPSILYIYRFQVTVFSQLTRSKSTLFLFGVSGFQVSFPRTEKDLLLFDSV